MTDNEVTPYKFERSFECFVVALACTNPKFWGRISAAIEIEGFELQASRDALAAVRDIANERGRGPDKAALVLQRLRSWMTEGKLPLARVHAVAEMLEDAADWGLPSPEAVLNEIVPVLKGRSVQALTLELVQESVKGSKADMGHIKRRVEQHERLGERDVSIGHRLGLGSLDRIKALSELDRLPFGIPELDSVLDGGMGHGLGIFIAGTGVGKSMFMCHAAAHALMNGLHVVYATLELPSEEIEARIVANLTGLPINALMSGQADLVAQTRLAAMEPFMGRLVTRDFTPKGTTVDDLIEWIEEVEAEAGVPVHVAIVDMLSKLKGWSGKKGVGPQSTYLEVGDVTETFRNYVKDRRKWGLSGMQPQRGAKDKKKIDTDDVADSMEAVRTADTVITASRTEDETQFEYFVAKSRFSEARKLVGPLPHDHACGRMCQIVRRIGAATW